MIKLTLYPKTTRYSESEKGYIITEKLDGSNLGNSSLQITKQNSNKFRK